MGHKNYIKYKISSAPVGKEIKSEHLKTFITVVQYKTWPTSACVRNAKVFFST